MSSSFHLPHDIKEQLEELSTCEVSDALIKLGISTGGFLPHLNIYSPKDHENVKLVGRVFTVRLVEQEKPDSSQLNGPKAEQHFVDVAPEGSVILISPDFVSGAACWGGLMSTAAKNKKIKGVVILGGCRDLIEHRKLNFPIFAQFHSTLGIKSFLRQSEYNISLSIPIRSTVNKHEQNIINQDGEEKKTLIDSGDILIGDIDGVVIIPFSKINQVIKIAKECKDIDENIRKDLELGKGVKETMKKWRGT
ncbi:uncharacterized protein I206_104226 [Kwoniella pini CBS 10737]|uniref:Uncharacterized protein n=1 Tax=Kwoniella pini CBS 10737 TaxID=1296096 RepID=A0A1B9I2D0_9TREE|nr:uncharacterized protein I206_04196 [Kwoniella pini CBS 10737]OCF49674.1 hypothetical protein I206_04196 [Kwoniella pini CBS 10737]